MAVWTMEQYNALCEAIAQGVLKVEYSDKKVEYRSLDEMFNLKDKMELALGLSKPANKRILVSYRKGTDSDTHN